MTRTRGLALLVTMTAGALVSAAGPAERTTAPSGIRLKAISSRVNGKGASLVIEATDPVPYVATRPDPLTVVVDFRNVVAEGVANSVAPNAKSPIASVEIEPVDGDAGTSRIRVALVQPVGHHVRAERNTIVIDFDKPSTKGAPFVLPPARVADPVEALGLSGDAAKNSSGTTAQANLERLAQNVAASTPSAPAPTAPGQLLAGTTLTANA